MAGGLTSAGRKAAGSHTGALTSEEHVWQALARQTGTRLVLDLDRFLDALLIFQTLAPRPQSEPVGRTVRQWRWHERTWQRSHCQGRLYHGTGPRNGAGPA